MPLTDDYIKHKYEPILPNKDEWPIVKLSKNRKEFINKVVAASCDRILSITGDQADEIREKLESTLYRERLRVKQNPWLIDPDDEKSFWSTVKASLVALSAENGLDEKKTERRIPEDSGKYCPQVCRRNCGQL